MRLLFVVFATILISSCRPVNDVYLGTVKDFSISGGGFLSKPTALIELDCGKKVSCELYKEICSGDSVWDGSLGITWDRPAKR